MPRVHILPPRDPRALVPSALLFGRCITAIRQDLGLSQEELAERLRIKRSALTHIETGRSAPSFYVLMWLGQHVGSARRDRDATAAFALFHLSARALRRQRIRVVNRPAREDDVILETVRIDRVVGAVFDAEFREFMPVEVVRFAGDEDDEE